MVQSWAHMVRLPAMCMHPGTEQVDPSVVNRAHMWLGPACVLEDRARQAGSVT
jgi:hypothetical protein